MEEIRMKYYENIRRVDNLLNIYDTFLSGTGRGRRSVIKTDVLRSAVVFLHSALEDFLRGISKEFLPNSDEATVDKVPLIGISDIGRPEKFFLGKLINHRNKMVSELIEESVGTFLRTLSFNDATEIVSWMRRVNINVSGNDNLSLINNMIQRRHRIVHEVDTNIAGGRGQHHAMSIDKRTVVSWKEATTRFVEEIWQSVI
jgi:hypothetical protein